MGNGGDGAYKSTAAKYRKFETEDGTQHPRGVNSYMEPAPPHQVVVQ